MKLSVGKKKSPFPQEKASPRRENTWWSRESFAGADAHWGTDFRYLEVQKKKQIKHSVLRQVFFYELNKTQKEWFPLICSDYVLPFSPGQRAANYVSVLRWRNRIFLHNNFLYFVHVYFRKKRRSLEIKCYIFSCCC